MTMPSVADDDWMRTVVSAPAATPSSGLSSRVIHAAKRPLSDVARQVANAHLLFNVLGVLAAVWFLPLIARGLGRLVPDRGAPRRGGERALTPAAT